MNELVPGAAHAKLPATYTAAKKALAECSRIDECQDWANKAHALASYARQAKDESLRRMADRIQARATRRCGELLKQIPQHNGGGASGMPRGGLLVDDPASARSAAARDAGMSKHQKDRALRVASIPEDDFNRAVETDPPAKISHLEAMGRNNGACSVVPDVSVRLEQVRKFARFCGNTDAASVAASVPDGDKPELKALIGEIDAWLDQFITTL